MKNKFFFLFFLMKIAFLFSYGCVFDFLDGSEDKKDEKVLAALNGKLVCRTNDFKIYFQDFSKLNYKRKLGSFSNSPPKWSINGEMFAFTAIENESNYIYIYDNRGYFKNKWLLSVSSENINRLTWSPDNTTVALLVSGSEIIYIDVFSGELSRYQIDVNQGFSSIAWCPGNDEIALSSGNKIYMVEPFKKYPFKRVLLTSDASQEIQYLDWNKDGSMLVYSGEMAYDRIFISDFDGSNNYQISKKNGNPIYGASACWVQDGTKIIYTSGYLSEKLNWSVGLFITDTDGSYDINLDVPYYEPDFY